jgi:coenzyme F420-0:L-glutamate ligase/coenzyme F420-1:gamma-L-glutamate ligase
LAKRLELFAPENFPLIEPGDRLSDLIVNSLRDEEIGLKQGDVLVLAQKVVSKSEGRLTSIESVEASDEAVSLAATCDKDARLVQLILDESTEILRCAPGVLIVRHKLGFVMANAGIDHSNIATDSSDEHVLLLPERPDMSARQLRLELETAVGCDLAVIISDSFGRPWRLGTTGVCIGCDGIVPLQDKRGEFDLFGNELMVTQIAMGDELATAASILMGQSDEARPLVILRGLEFEPASRSARDLIRPANEDLFK